jgi:hypothetical protein
MCTWLMRDTPLTVGPSALWTLCAERSLLSSFSFSPPSLPSSSRRSRWRHYLQSSSLELETSSPYGQR